MKGIRSTVSEIEAKGAQGARASGGRDQRSRCAAHGGRDACSSFGRLDILVNNAGIRPEAALEDLTLQAWRDVMAVSLDGAFLCVKAALSALEKTKGTIVNIGGLDRLYGRGAPRACGCRESGARRSHQGARGGARAARDHGQSRGAGHDRHGARGRGTGAPQGRARCWPAAAAGRTTFPPWCAFWWARKGTT